MACVRRPCRSAPLLTRWQRVSLERACSSAHCRLRTSTSILAWFRYSPRSCRVTLCVPNTDGPALDHGRGKCSQIDPPKRHQWGVAPAERQSRPEPLSAARLVFPRQRAPRGRPSYGRHRACAAVPRCVAARLHALGGGGPGQGPRCP